ncbi:MAG TPA: pyridoxal-phosphate dependent enzyme, partial [Nevskiaceae bacterium]|nr:pyridoxal-phosphate dependent enzyme [Nevskiaceae bacterium]
MGESAGQDRATLASFYGDMERLLTTQLQASPKDHNVRLKLLEVYYETHRKSDFLREAHNLARDFDRKRRAADWNRMVSMGRMLGLEDRLFDEHVGDSITFVEPSKLGPGNAPGHHQRIGESPEYQEYFARLADAWAQMQADPRFLIDLDQELLRSANRPSSMQNAKRLTVSRKGAQIYFKREDLSPPGSQLSIAIIGQALLAQKLYKNTLVTATKTGFRGVVTAAAAARLGLKCRVFMDREDMHRHQQTVFQMRLLGAEMIGVTSTRFQDNDVRIGALEHCAENPDKNFLALGLDGAPPPYPTMTREFLSTIGRESRRQVNAFSKRPPDLLAARGGDTLDAIGF